MTRLLPLAIILLAACNQQEQPAAPVKDMAEAPAAKLPVPSLKGEWRVTSISGRPGASLSASFGEGTASLSAGCLKRAFTYTQDRNTVSVKGAPGGSNCGGSSAAAETAFGALADANLLIFDKDGREATLSGPGGTLALERR